MTKILKKSLLLLSVLFFTMISCEEENLIVDEHTHSHQNKNSISFNEFLKKTKLKNVKLKIDYPKNNEFNLRQANAFNSFVIDTTLVLQKLQSNNLYTFAMPVTPLPFQNTEDLFYNIVFYKNANLWEWSVLEYEKKPSKELEYNVTEIINDSNNNGLVQLRSQIVWSTIATYHCTNTGSCARTGICDLCNLCVTTSTTMHINNSNEAISEFEIAVPDFGVSYGGGADLHQGFLNSLSPTQLDYYNSLDFETQSDITNYLISNSYNDEAEDFVEDLFDISIDLEINASEIWFNDYDVFRSQMSYSEKIIFDNLLPNRKMWYMVSAYTAKTKAEELYPNSLHNGIGDAFRHAYWNGLSTKYMGSILAEQLTTAHENRPSIYPFNFMENNMDLFNNEKGRIVASYSNISNILDNIIEFTEIGGLRYLNNLDNTGLATANSQLIPTH